MAEPVIEIKFDEAKLRNIQRLLQNIPRAIPKVICRSINRTVTPVRTSMAKQLLGRVNAELAAVKAMQKASGRKVAKTGKGTNFRFKSSTIKQNIKFQRATYKRWQGLIWIKSLKGQEAQATAETAFIARMPKSGKISIFKRLGAARLPIADQLRRLMRMYFMGFSGQIKREAQARFERNIEDQVKLALAQWKAKARRAG